MKLHRFIFACALALSISNAYAGTGPLKRFGMPNGFQNASSEIVKGLQIPQGYGIEIGSNGERSEVWMLQSNDGFEHGIVELFEWMGKNDLVLTQRECYSQQNQQCEFVASNEAGSVGLNLASTRPKQDFLLLILRIQSAKDGE